VNALSRLNEQRKAWREANPAAHDMVVAGLVGALIGAVGVLWVLV